jgi:hypothetical protein
MLVSLLGLVLTAPAASALPLLVERFDAAELSEGWKTRAAKGGGASASWAVEGGALVGRAEAKAKRFPTIYRRVELWEVAWIRVDVRRKASGVAGTGTCDVYLKFDTLPAEPARPCAEAGDWAEASRFVAVPAGAREVEVGFALDGPGTVSFDDLVVEPVTPDWKRLTRGHFDYHWLGDDLLREEHLVANEEAYDRVLAFLALDKAVDLAWWKYPDLQTVGQYTGESAEVVVRGDTVHTLRRANVPALVQVLARAWGDPPPLLAAGLGVHLAGDWDGKSARQVARGLAGRGEAPTIAAMLDPVAFAALPEATRLPVAGAFVEWVVETKGQPALRALYGALKAGADTRAPLEAALGVPLADADTAFRAWL